MAITDPIIRNYEKQLVQKLIQQEALFNNAFNRFIRNVAPYLRQWTANNRANVWIRNSQIENAVDRALVEFQSDLLFITKTQQAEAWNLGDLKTDDLFKRYIKGMGLSSTIKEGLFVRNAEALKAFQVRKAAGLDLSQRVWKIANQSKEHIELFLESGIATGRSAEEISRDLRQYLKEPDKRFRRVRDPETNKLVLSNPAKNYHPGQGVYRSSFQNALRVARTEVNMAYRFADHERWKETDFVTGVEVKLSASHPVFDICDHMAGQYPKDFKFGGWHQACICYSVPVLLPQDDFVASLFGDYDPSKQYVKTMPKNAQNYIVDNTDRFRGWKNEPYWLRDNFKFKNGAYVPTSNHVVTKQ